MYEIFKNALKGQYELVDMLNKIAEYYIKGNLSKEEKEELGLVGVLFIIGLLMFIVYKGFLYAGLTDSFFFKLVCVGISSYIGVQTFVNLGGISGAIPLTGVPLPFMTFGGSSMLSLSIAIGILLLTAKQIKIDNIERRR